MSEARWLLLIIILNVQSIYSTPYLWHKASSASSSFMARVYWFPLTLNMVAWLLAALVVFVSYNTWRGRLNER